MIVAAKSAQMAHIPYRQSLQEIFFAKVNARLRNIGMQGHARAFFKFSGNMFAGNEKFLFQRTEGEVVGQVLADIFKYIVDKQNLFFVQLVYLVILDTGTQKDNEKRWKQAFFKQRCSKLVRFCGQGIQPGQHGAHQHG